MDLSNLRLCFASYSGDVTISRIARVKHCSYKFNSSAIHMDFYVFLLPILYT